MRGVALSALALWALAAPNGARAGDALPPMPDFAVGDRLRPEDPMPERRIDWGRADVQMTDVVYATLPEFRPLHLDLYRPAAHPGPLPLIVFAHGGGWAHANPRAGGSFKNFPAVLAYLATRGYVVASIEYRFTGEAPFPAPVEDLQTAIRFLRGKAEHFGIDGARVGLWGMSAGAFLVAMNGVNCAAGACVQGLASWFGPYDFTGSKFDQPGDAGLRQWLGCGPVACTPAVLEAASPIHYVDARDPPTLVVQGTSAEEEDFPAQAEHFVGKLRAAGVAAELLLIPNVGHGFVGPSTAVTTQATRQALTATFDFFDRVLKNAAPQSTP